MMQRVQRSTIVVAAIMLLVVVLGIASYKTNGFAFARPQFLASGPNQFGWDHHTNDACLAKVRTKPMFCIQRGDAERITVAILGDSTANSLVPGVAELAQAHNEGIIDIGQGSCPPVRGMLPTTNNPDCPSINEDAYRVVLAEKNVNTVILAFFTNDIGSQRFRDTPENPSLDVQMARLVAGLDADIAALNAAGKKVILTYDTPLSPIDAKDCATRPIPGWMRKAKDCRVKESEIVNRHPQLEMLDKHFLGRRDVCVFHQSPLLFTHGQLNYRDDQGDLLIRDRHHLSVHGSRKMAQLLEQSPCSLYMDSKKPLLKTAR